MTYIKTQLQQIMLLNKKQKRITFAKKAHTNRTTNHFSIKYFILLLICIASKVIYINEKFNSHDVYGAP